MMMVVMMNKHSNLKEVQAYVLTIHTKKKYKYRYITEQTQIHEKKKKYRRNTLEHITINEVTSI